jgi:hypothetical protein
MRLDAVLDRNKHTHSRTRSRRCLHEMVKANNNN